MRYLFLFIAASLFFSCTRYITETITVREIDSTWVETRDTLYTHLPDSMEFIDSSEIISLKENNIQLNSIINLLHEDIHDYDSLVINLKTKLEDIANQKINTDTLWIHGNFADAWSRILDNQLRLGLVEGKEFNIKLENAITERNRFREIYYKKISTVPAKPDKPSFWDNIKSVLKYTLFIIIALIVFIFIFKTVR